MGYNNKAFVSTDDEGKEYIIRLVGKYWKTIKTESEVVCLRFIAETTSIPVPHVYAWESDSKKSSIGCEYIIMQKMPGQLLHAVWNELSTEQRISITKQLAHIVAELRKRQFNRIGSFIRGKSWDQPEIGPSVEMTVGPWNSYSEYLEARFETTIRRMHENVKYLPMKEYEPKIRRFMDFIFHRHVPSELQDVRIVLTHGDLETRNILIVDNKISAILDWEFAGASEEDRDWIDSFDFTKDKDLVDSTICREVFNNDLKSLGIRTPSDIPGHQLRKDLMQMAEEIAHWYITHLPDDSEEIPSMIKESKTFIDQMYETHYKEE